MADKLTVVPRGQQHQRTRLGGGAGGGGPSASKILTTLAILPVGFTLLTLAGITLTGTIIGLCLATPVFFIFSPVIVPAAIAIGLTLTGFFTSGALGLTALSSFSWVFSSFGNISLSDMADRTKRTVASATDTLGQRTKDAGAALQGQAQDVSKTDTGGLFSSQEGGRKKS